MKKYRFEIILVIINAIYMILEVVASRILAPYFGSSNIVWTSVVGIILLSSSIGNYIGGIIADKDENEKKLKTILFFSFISVIIVPFLQNMILTGITQLIPNFKIGAILSTAILFFTPSLFVGTITPIILKLKIKDNNLLGRTSRKSLCFIYDRWDCRNLFWGFFSNSKFW